MDAKKRLLYIDNIRLVMIVLVVIVHLALTYSGPSSWYYVEARPLDFFSGAFFSFLYSFLQAFFMGFLFLIAGYFVPGAYDRKGFGKFLKDRAIRLGIPSLIYMFIIDPFIEYVLVGRYVKPGQSFFSYYQDNIISLHFFTGTGPLWFALVLLVFTIIYALIRLFMRRSQAASQWKITPKARTLGVLMLIIAAFAFLIRTVLPIGTRFFNMKLCFFAQYIVLFIVGILAYRQDLFSKLSYKLGSRLLYWSPVWGLGSWGAMMIAFGALSGGDTSLMNGGFTWQSALYALWESFTAVAMGVGFLVVFREKWNSQSRFISAMSNSAFAVYVFHTPIILAVMILFGPVQWPPILKFLTMIVVCVPVCFTVSYVLKKIPGLRKVI